MAASTDRSSESIRVVVDVIGHLRDVVGTKQLEVVLDVPSIAGLIDRLSEDHGEEFKNLVVDVESGDFRVCVLVNGKDADFLEKSNTKLRNGDKIAMIPLAAGGSRIPVSARSCKLGMFPASSFRS